MCLQMMMMHTRKMATPGPKQKMTMMTPTGVAASEGAEAEVGVTAASEGAGAEVGVTAAMGGEAEVGPAAGGGDGSGGVGEGGGGGGGDGSGGSLGMPIKGTHAATTSLALIEIGQLCWQSPPPGGGSHR